MKKVVKRIGTIKNSRTVLVTGETGAGKELVAKALAERGDRSGKPLVTLDCTNLDKENMRSELFGHERGSFTGAVNQKTGLFEKADGGTAFLDEIGDVPMDLQPRLLRVLENGTFRRLGGNTELKSDFHLIAATNRNLATMVRERTFREDLYYRIKLFSVHVPPLRERTDDIARLANHFVDNFSGRTKRLATDAEAAIRNHSWPGNVRELKSAIERAVLFANGNEAITVENLELDPVRFIETTESIIQESMTLVTGTRRSDVQKLMDMLINCIHDSPVYGELTKVGGLKLFLEKLAIESILRFNGGNKRKAALDFGIGRQTLYNRLEHYENERIVATGKVKPPDPDQSQDGHVEI
jgi:DNA-binding NtrC family response regulator